MAAICYVVVFDLSDDRERGKLADCLEGFGLRVQKSVFECRLTRSALRRLTEKIELLQMVSGHCSFYKVGNAFSRTIIGVAPKETSAEDHHAFVL